jgi:hypothetical protein
MPPWIWILVRSLELACGESLMSAEPKELKGDLINFAIREKTNCGRWHENYLAGSSWPERSRTKMAQLYKSACMSNTKKNKKARQNRLAGFSFRHSRTTVL